MLWIGTDGGGLNRFDPAVGHFTHYQHDPNVPGGLPNDKVLAIQEDHNGFLWVGTYGGLVRIDPITKKFLIYQHDPTRANSLSSDRVRTLYEDSQGFLWIGTDGGGLNLFDPVRGTFRRFLHDPNDSSSLSNDTVWSIYQDLDGTLWIGTSSGMNQWVPESESFLHYVNDPANPASLVDDRVKTLIQDHGGVLWIGTANGVSRWNYVSDSFTYYEKTNSKASYLLSNTITAVDQAIYGEIWVGTYGGGLSRIDSAGGTAKHYRHDPEDQNSLSSDEVMSVFVDRDNQVWVGTHKNGLNRLDPATGRVHRYRHDATDPHSISDNGITRIHGDADGTLWVATYGGGLNRRSPGTDQFEVFRHDPDDANSLSSNRVLSLYRDNAGTLWIGTEDAGFNELVESSGTFLRYQHEPGNVESLSSDAAWEMLEGSDGSFWVGTRGGGLNRWLPEDRRVRRNRFIKYGKREGLSSNTVNAILHDKHGALWLSGNSGLTRMEPASGSLRHFDNLNALKSNDFVFGARLRGSDGTLMFGGTDGLVVFNPDRIRTNSYRPPVVVTALTRLQPLASSSSVTVDVPMVELDHTDYSVTFEFAAMDFNSPDKNRYRYQLQGFDRDWVDPLQYRRATYTNLPADTYLFQVQAANNDGIWNDTGAFIQLQVNPPPWRSDWAYALYALSAASFLGLLLHLQHKKSSMEAEQRARLEEQVRVRTQELSERNSDLEELNDKFKEASLTDSLTGLKNRRYFYELIEVQIPELDRQIAKQATMEVDSRELTDQSGLFFMMIDLDGFKKINDNHGHNAGDQALLQVRDILNACSRSSDTVIRWGGDEFLIVGRTDGRVAAEQFAERLRTELATHPYTLGNGETASLSGSIGFAIYPFVPSAPGLLHWESVVVIADQAAYIAKENQRNAWVGIYSRATATTAHALLDIRDDLEGLLQRDLVKINTSIDEDRESFLVQPKRATR